MNGAVMDFGKFLIVVGGLVLLLGLIIKFAPWLVAWFGKLPGDIRIESERTTVFIPVTTMIVISLLLTLLVNLFFRK